MIDRAESGIKRLADAFAQMRASTAHDEIVQWLRAAVHLVASIPKPQNLSPNRDYTRTVLHRCEDFEILVLHWPANCLSAIHDHGGSLCWLTVASGSLGVENYARHVDGNVQGYARISRVGHDLLRSGDIDHRQDDMNLHRCITYAEPAVSLHIYARPIERFNIFDERRETCNEVSAVYDAVHNVLPL